MSLIVIESSEDEEENDEEREKITENGRHYVESYLHTNDADRNEALNTALRARLKNQPRFLFRYVSKKHFVSNSTSLGFRLEIYRQRMTARLNRARSSLPSTMITAPSVLKH